MKKMLYPRLAWNGICKNRQLYIPYILSCIGMVMMFYIIQALSYLPTTQTMKGGSSLGMILSLGKIVVSVFSLLFLLYTNSFLTRKRYKEFGLYNILGMGKNSISLIAFWESLIVSVIGLAGGIVTGVVFSKLAELGLDRVTNTDINYAFSMPFEALYYTVTLYGLIFLILLCKSVLQVRRSKPLELMHSDHLGEKPPRANWIFAILGVIILAVAYYMAVSIQSPLTALLMFFVAVILVIIATYLLFISGSVALCKILQKNKKYYYRKNHFVSVSTMAYRMKRNGAGLASICILATMVLVMISSSASLYFGAEDSIHARFPRDLEVEVSMDSLSNLSDGTTDKVRAQYESVFASHQFTPADVQEYRYASITGLLKNTSVDPSVDIDSSLYYDDIRQVYFISVEDYNRAMGTDYKLGANEAMLYTLRCSYKETSIAVDDLTWNITSTLSEFPALSEAATFVIPSIMLVVSDYSVLSPLASLVDFTGDKMLLIRYHHGYNYRGIISADEAGDVLIDQLAALRFVFTTGFSSTSGYIDNELDDFFITFGGLFFLGIVLSILFIFAAAVIIYYKQMSEGLEDQARFAIMQKVGMTKEDIKKSIDSQVLTVFFAPLLFAGLHLIFAFPVIWKMLQLFSLTNLTLVIIVSIIAFLVYGLFYALIYKLTARTYYGIVSANA